jgi:hypothetical protein
MTISYGNVPAGTVLYIPFHTFNAAGASVTITGLAATDIEIYKNGSTTQRSSDNGYTLLDTDGIDFDGITGIHGFSVDTGDNTDSGFFSAGAQYWVVVSTITADSQTVSFIAATFRIEPAAGINANVVSNAGTAITAASGIQEVKVASIAANAITATAINADAITNAKIADDAIAVENIKDGAITAAKIASDAITDAKVASDVTIASVTGAVGSVTGAVGSVTGNVGGNVTGSVGSVATGGITAASFAADAITAAKIHSDVTTELQSGLATASAVSALQTSVDDLPTNSELATALGTADDAVLAQVALVKAVTDKLDDTLEDDAGTFRFTTNALEQAPTGGSAPTASAIADEVETRTMAAVTLVNGLAANSVTASALAADAVTEIQSGLATATALNTVDDLLDTEVAAIKTVVDAVKVQTDKLTFTVANQIDANIQYVNDTELQGTGDVGVDEWRAV